jgi:hypothetical protein
MFQHIAKFYNSQVDRYSSRYPHIAMRRGPYLHPSASLRELCVWPLRIPSQQRCDEFFIATSALATTVHGPSQNEDVHEATL